MVKDVWFNADVVAGTHVVEPYERINVASSALILPKKWKKKNILFCSLFGKD